MNTGRKHSCSSGNLQILKELEKYSQTIESNNIQTKMQATFQVNIKQQQKHILDFPMFTILYFIISHTTL